MHDRGGSGRARWLAPALVVVLAAACSTDDDPQTADDGAPSTGQPDVAELDGEVADPADPDEVDAPVDDDTPPSETDPSGAPLAIDADDLELNGLLRLPDHEGPHVGIVIAHGSGPVDRYGTMRGQLGLSLPQPVRVYEQLAIGLQERGFAVLTWDKRSCGPFNSCSNNGYPAVADDLTIDVLRDDVTAAVDALDARDDIDEVVVLGHSKGGTLALHVAAASDAVSAVITYGTPIAPIDEVLPDQAQRFTDLVEAAGQSDIPAAAQEVDAIHQMAVDVAAIRDGEIDGDPVGGASRAFWASWLEASDAVPALLDDLAAPLLVLGGEHDWNVAPERIRQWQPHLRDGDHLEVLGSLTHALTWLGEDDPAEMTVADLGVDVDDAAIDTITAWLTTALGR